MIRIALTFLILISGFSYAQKPAGFLWYNIDQDKKHNQKKLSPGIPFNKLSFTQRDAVLHFYTMEALHKARQTKKIEDMRIFLSLQDYWLKESSRFKTLFQKTMLKYPQYDYTVTHPSSNIGTKITDEVREAQKIKILNKVSLSHGLLFFYRGQSPYDLKQIPMLIDFCTRFGFSMISISVDGAIAPELPDSKIDKGQSDSLGVRYFPAILLVSPKNQRFAPLAYGLTTQDILMERVKQVATKFKEDD